MSETTRPDPTSDEGWEHLVHGLREECQELSGRLDVLEVERDCYREALRFIAQGNLNRIADLGAAGALAEVTNAALEALDDAARLAP